MAAQIQPLFLDDAALRGLGLTQAEIVDAVETALADEAAGTAWTTPKSVITPGDGRYLMSTLSLANTPGLSVVKFVQVSPDNPDRGLPTINGTIMVHDGQTGLLRAVLDANWITAVRTAGLSGVAARRLANPRSRAIAFIGAGVQAQSHLDCFAALFPIDEIRIHGRGQANIDRLAAKARDMGIRPLVAEGPKQALTGADIVVTSITLTSSAEPFLDARWLKPGAFATVTDAGVPWIDTALPGFSSIIVDDVEQENSSPKRMAPKELVTGELKQLVAQPDLARFDPDRRTAFMFRGLAIGDFAVSALAYQRATDLRKGQK